MGSFVAGFIAWVLGKLFGIRKQIEMEKKYVETKKENIEIRAENSALKTKIQQLKDLKERNEKWDKANNRDKWEILLGRGDKR